MSFKPVNEVSDAKAARKRRQAFYTPLELCAVMVAEADLWASARVLEPSAGDGRLVHLMKAEGVESIDACEIDEGARARLVAVGECNLVATDFLAYRPAEPYDRIVMNPPFAGRTYLKHIEHAWSMLAPSGRIVTLAPIAFGEQLAECSVALPGCISATWEEVDADAFREYEVGIRVALATLDRAHANAPQVRICGFSNHATANASLVIESHLEFAQIAAGIFDAATLKTEMAPRIGALGGSCYGVEWREVLAHLRYVDPPQEASPAPPRPEKAAASRRSEVPAQLAMQGVLF